MMNRTHADITGRWSQSIAERLRVDPCSCMRVVDGRLLRDLRMLCEPLTARACVAMLQASQRRCTDIADLVNRDQLPLEADEPDQ